MAGAKRTHNLRVLGGPHVSKAQGPRTRPAAGGRGRRRATFALSMKCRISVRLEGFRYPGMDVN